MVPFLYTYIAYRQFTGAYQHYPPVGLSLTPPHSAGGLLTLRPEIYFQKTAHTGLTLRCQLATVRHVTVFYRHSNNYTRLDEFSGIKDGINVLRTSYRERQFLPASSHNAQLSSCSAPTPPLLAPTNDSGPQILSTHIPTSGLQTLLYPYTIGHIPHVCLYSLYC